ncbi:hypothetical protein BJX76DRAFT_292733 [Aspergillus varians]
MSSPEITRAIYACLPCRYARRIFHPQPVQNGSQRSPPHRTLKRKCTRELPACLLCIRLSKVCDYTATNTQHEDTQARVVTPRPESRQEGQNVASLPQFPASFFLDSESHQQLAESQAMPIPVPMCHRDFLAPVEDYVAMTNKYFFSIQTWMPFISEKRLARRLQERGPEADLGLALRLTCMRLVVSSPTDWEAAVSSPFYHKAKELLSVAENACLTCLDLVQGAILISVYEMGHGLYPSAFLTTSHAARLGMVLGLHDRKNAPQLFQPPDTWTLREEERRTWWAVLILDRSISLGISGVPLATPEPMNGDLLPCLELPWNQGQLGTNEPLFVESLSGNSPIGSYANTCQAAHITGRVLSHRNRVKLDADHRSLLMEAQQLHQMLTSLSRHLLQQHLDNRLDPSSDRLVAVALCGSARLILANMYACNEHYPPLDNPRLPEETAMQQASIQSIEEMINHGCEVARTVLNYAVVSLDTVAPTLCHFLYQTASECAWVLREFDSEENKGRLDTIVRALITLSQRWKVAGTYSIRD